FATLMRTDESPLAASTRQVLQQIIRAAVENRGLPPTAVEASKHPPRREGDVLTAYSVRTAARAALTLPDEVAVQSFLLALAIGLDNGATPANPPGMANIERAIEPASERQIRLAVLGKPTIRNQLDLTQVFFAAAYSAAASGVEKTQTAFIDAEFAKAQ